MDIQFNFAFLVVMISARLVFGDHHQQQNEGQLVKILKKQQTEGHLVKILKRSRRGFGYRTKCIDQVKKQCQWFTVGGMTKLFCVARVVPHCTALDK